MNNDKYIEKKMNEISIKLLDNSISDSLRSSLELELSLLQHDKDLEDIDRSQFEYLNSQKKSIQRKIDELTKDSWGRTYASKMRAIVYAYVDFKISNTTGRQTPSRYATYTKYHSEVTKALGINSKVITKKEFKDFVGYVEKNWIDLEIIKIYLDKGRR